MSLTTIINIATSGVLAQQTAIAATSENIANITTPDFARRTVNFSADPVSGQFSGVRADIVRDASSAFLQNATLTSAADASAASSRETALTRIVTSLGETGDGLSFADRASEATAAFARLGASPASAAARDEAIALLDQALAAFAQTQSVITGEQSAARDGLDFDIAQANSILEQINTLNTQLSQSGGNNNAADALSSQLSTLARLLTINVTRDDLGRATVTTQSGHLLADSSGAARFDLGDGASPALTLSALSQVPQTVEAGTDDISDELTGGSIGGALTLINTDLATLAEIVSDARAGFVQSLNNASAGNSPFPLSSVLSGTNSLDDAAITNLNGTTSFGVITANGVLQSRIDLDFTNNTIRVDGGAPTSFAPTLDGVSSAISTALQGRGIATFTDGQVRIEATNGDGLALANDNAGFGVLAGINPLIVQGANGLQTNRAALAAGRIDLTDTAPGDVVTGATDGNGANALFEAGRGQANGLANVLGQIGAAANAASERASVAQAFADSISAQAVAEGGVNLEEELSNLILFQRSFNANARVLAAADELYQSILALI